MDSFFFRFKNALVLIAIVLLQVVALAVQVQRPAEGARLGSAPDGARITLLRRWSVALVTPVERAVHATSFETQKVWQNYLDLRGARKQNAQLQQEVTRLREEQEAFAEEAAQGRRLEKILGFQQTYIAKTVAAQVIGTSGSDRSHVLYLDKGWKDGLRPDQAVITPDGVVGKLRDVFPRTSQLLLINDSSSGAGVILVSSRIRGVLRGTVNGQVEINNLTEDSRIKPGEKVITSGGDEVFPRGLPVGTIESIAPDPEHQPFTAIVIKPAADLTRLEEVLVITKTSTTLPPAMQADAVAAEATADENQRAADVLAAKLPNVGDAAAAASGKPQMGPDGKPVAATADESGLIGGLPGIPYSGLPRVTPTVHADRYTPGATPPAADMTP
ncbi:MAG: rod shape-determining protein MreC, partial [Acetobacteraceae bacterium]